MTLKKEPRSPKAEYVLNLSQVIYLHKFEEYQGNGSRNISYLGKIIIFKLSCNLDNVIKVNNSMSTLGNDQKTC